MQRASRMLLAGLLVACPACAHSGASTKVAQVQPQPGPPVELNVVNHHSSPVDVYAVAAGASYRMGSVPPGLTGHFELRRSMMLAGGTVEFLADPGSGDPPVSSGQLLLAPGDVVDFVIGGLLANSRATVRP